MSAGVYLSMKNHIDRSIPEYETVLSPSDFERTAELANSPQYNKYIPDDSEAMYGNNLFEGDIANKNLNASTVEVFLNGGVGGGTGGGWYNAIKNRHQLWPDGRIPYTISSQYSSYSRSQIAASMQEYATHTCIQWVPKTNTDINYVYIFPDRGCYSMVGKIGGKQSLSLGPGCIQRGIIIHELMHAVGFFHEQSRSDRDDFITILWNNIQPGMQGQFEKYGQGVIQSLGTTYDYSSIMHYGDKAFSRNGQPTMVPKQKGAQIGQRSGFSKTDIFKINQLYGCPDGGKTKGPTTTTVETTTATLPTAPPITTTTPTTIYPILTSTLPTVTVCVNLRRDCDDLERQGWCQRNPGWMRKHCPVSCGFCEKKPDTSSTLAPIVPGECEDLRVDCLVLVAQRYCRMSQNFMKTYCAKSCGFCYRPPPVEIGSTSSPFITAVPPPMSRTTTSGILQTLSTRSPSVTTTESTCRDYKHFCSHWKMAGFCEGIFMNYMKKNCPLSCGMC
ncbi:hypothetical protein Q1695_001590 [Nippostrongylus brasiliensis]|nr:hypothetical protein Q1695_001590 [Nippostrongylus brasiliensis]